MEQRRAKERVEQSPSRAATGRFRLAYYAICIMIGAALVGILYLGSLLG